jgi:hypothetical protein
VSAVRGAASAGIRRAAHSVLSLVVGQNTIASWQASRLVTRIVVRPEE